jgi:hypothetical protein
LCLRFYLCQSVTSVVRSPCRCLNKETDNRGYETLRRYLQFQALARRQQSIVNTQRRTDWQSVDLWTNGMAMRATNSANEATIWCDCRRSGERKNSADAGSSLQQIAAKTKKRQQKDHLLLPFRFISRGDMIRTCDFCVPNAAL